MSERFGEIRSVLNKGESTTNWARLCELVDGFEEGELDQMVFPYVAGHVRGWNPRTCVAPREWVYRALVGEDLPFWSMVRMLDLSLEYLNSDQLHALLRSDRVQRIEVINLESNRIGAAGAREIAEAEHLVHIEELRLGFNHLKLAGMLWLARAEALDGLKHLYMDENSLGDSGVSALAKASWLGQLETLVLSDNGMTQVALSEILEALDATGAVRKLVLDHNSFKKSESAMRLLARGFEGLEELELRRCELQGSEVRALRGRWPELRKLDLSRNDKVRVGALAELFGDGEFPALERVYLGATGADHELCEALLGLPSLRYVEMPIPSGYWARVPPEVASRYDGLREQGVRVMFGR